MLSFFFSLIVRNGDVPNWVLPPRREHTVDVTCGLHTFMHKTSWYSFPTDGGSRGWAGGSRVLELKDIPPTHHKTYLRRATRKTKLVTCHHLQVEVFTQATNTKQEETVFTRDPENRNTKRNEKQQAPKFVFVVEWKTANVTCYSVRLKVRRILGT